MTGVRGQGVAGLRSPRQYSITCRFDYARRLWPKPQCVSMATRTNATSWGIHDGQRQPPDHLFPMPKRSRLVMEMMAIPGRSGEEAAIMDFIRGKLAEAGVPAERAGDRRCASPHAARRAGRQSGAEAAGHGSRPAADALRPRRHRAHLRRFAPGAKGQARCVGRSRRPGWGPTTGPGRPCC